MGESEITRVVVERDRLPKLEEIPEATALGIGTNGFDILLMMFKDAEDGPIAVMRFDVAEATEMKAVIIASINEAIARIETNNGAMN
jgi:phosphomannomutase